MEKEETIGSKNLIKRSEFIRLITGALYSLGFDRIATLVERDSGIILQNDPIKQFLRQVKDGEWDESISTLQKFHLHGNKDAIFLLLEQKVLDIMRNEGQLGVEAARSIIFDEMMPLDINYDRCQQLIVRLSYGIGDGSYATSRSKFLELLQNILLKYPERRLEYLLEENIDRKRICGAFHNIPDSELSLYYDHYCGISKIPSKTLQILEAHTDQVLLVEFSFNGKYLASSSKDKSAIIWEINREGKLMQKHRLLGHEKPVVAVSWSPDDKHVLTCGENEVIRSWDVETGAFLQLYERNGVASVSCGWYCDGSVVIGGMADKRIYLWNLDGSEVQHMQLERAQERSDVAMTTDGKWLVSLSKENEISLFDRQTGLTRLFPKEDMITSFSLSSDSKHLLIDLITPKIHILNIEKEPYMYLEFTGHKRTPFITRSCFGGFEESFIASGGEDCQVYIWSRKVSTTPCRVLAGHSGAVKCVSWNPKDMHMLASASDDGTIRIWGLDDSVGN